VEDGAFFAQDGAPVSKTKSVEQSAGRAEDDLAQSTDGVKARTALTLRFKALASGSANFKLLSAAP
jgi:hypothetical protein